MPGLWEQLRRFWQSDRGLSVLLVVLALLIFVAPALNIIGRPGRTLVDVLFTLVLIAGVGVVSARREVTWAVIVLGVAVMVMRWIAWFATSTDVQVASALLSLAGVGVLAALTLAQVLRAGPVNLHRILGAVAVYLLLGLMWGAAYEVVSILLPGAFSSGQPNDAQHWMYFSFVTLTTTGYGDITPVAPVARSLAVLEAMTGQLFVAILIARLVSLEVASRKSK